MQASRYVTRSLPQLQHPNSSLTRLFQQRVAATQFSSRSFSANHSACQHRLSTQQTLQRKHVTQLHPIRHSLNRQTTRWNSSNSRDPRPLTDRPDVPESKTEPRQEPAYELTFTCKPCLTRSKHRMSKQGYHHGTVVISCPNCKNRHIISDHLKIFNDKAVTVEQLLAQKGEKIKMGTLGEDGDIEFWDDGTSNKRDGADATEQDALPAQDEPKQRWTPADSSK